MADASTIKKQVRKRDRQCRGCGMTPEEHKRRFGKNLDVHRKKYRGWSGRYEVDDCLALCRRCHLAEHHFKWSIRKRDGYACTECGIIDEEESLSVHCTRGGLCHAKELEWMKRNVKPEECYTLCSFCHLRKHSIRPAVLRRDNFQCVDCGKHPDDNRLWHKTVTVHRLSGYCYEEIGPDTDPAGFVTLCLECHEKLHPNKFAECIQYGFAECIQHGGTVCLDKGLAAELDITLPITRKDQLAPYKEYLLLVNKFIQHFRKNGLPANDYQLLKLARDYPEIELSRWLREQAAVEARSALMTANSFAAAPIASFSRKEKKAMRRMREDEKNALIREREERHLTRGERYLEDFIRRNAESMIEIDMRNGHRCRVSI